MSGPWEVFAVKYCEQKARLRGNNFLFDDNHNAPYPIDFFIWVLRRGDEVIVVDTGFDTAEAQARARPILVEPHTALAPLGIDGASVKDVIVTHLHFDHAGGMHLFPNARLHLQAAEMAFATGPCMCHDAIRNPFTARHVVEAVERLYQGRLVFYEGEGEVAEGVTVHCIGGHSRGLQAVRVRTEAGWMCLASDAAHFYENVLAKKPFPIVIDMQDMLDGFGTVERLASAPGLIIPGHDPLVGDLFPEHAPNIFRLDHGPLRALPDFG